MEGEEEIERDFSFSFHVEEFFSTGGGPKKTKRQHQKPGAGLPFILFSGPSFPTSAAEIDPREEAYLFSPPSFRGAGGKEGREGGGLGEREQEERAARAAFFVVLLFSCRQLFFFPLWLLLTRAGLTTRLPYPRGSLPFYSSNAESHYLRGHTTKNRL